MDLPLSDLHLPDFIWCIAGGMVVGGWVAVGWVVGGCLVFAIGLSFSLDDKKPRRSHDRRGYDLFEV